MNTFNEAQRINLVCLDLEGVLIPEIWIACAQHTGIEELTVTTREIADYDELMRLRISILDRHRIRLPDIQAVLATIEPLEGALDFLMEVRTRCPLIIVSDTFTQFAQPLLPMLSWPTLLCNTLVVDDAQRIIDYRLRQHDGKRHVAEAFRTIGYRVIAAGDSYNDVSMIQSADHGAFFRPPDTIVADYPDIPVCNSYDELSRVLFD